MTKHPGHPKHDYPANPDDLHQLPSVTDFEDALVREDARINRSYLSESPPSFSDRTSKPLKLPHRPFHKKRVDLAEGPTFISTTARQSQGHAFYIATSQSPSGHTNAMAELFNAALKNEAVREVAEETGMRAVVLGEPAFAHAAVQGHTTPWAVIEMDVTDSKDGQHRHIDFVYVCRASGGDLTAQLEEVADARWVPIADVADLPTPVELPELAAAATRWAKSPVQRIGDAKRSRG